MTTSQALDAGIEQWKAANRAELLKRARTIALQLAKNNGEVTADDVAKRLDQPLGPVAGSIFKTSDFEFTGARIRSTQKNNHARELKVWRLTPSGKTNAQKASEPISTSLGSVPTVQKKRRNPAIAPMPSWLSCDS